MGGIRAKQAISGRSASRITNRLITLIHVDVCNLQCTYLRDVRVWSLRPGEHTRPVTLSKLDDRDISVKDHVACSPPSPPPVYCYHHLLK